ncbi:MAG TPA: sigma 54-interacting transcriptional regulator [Polyangiaceae bacterium]
MKTVTQRPRFRLRIERGRGPRLEILSSEERVVIGSSPQADLVVDDGEVSGIHCEIAWEDEGFVLRDLKSAHGTWLSGVRVREVVLPGEAHFDIGGSGLSFGSVSGGDEIALHPDDHFGGLTGESAVMRAVFARLARIASRESTVLLEGESGTGKELAARAIHDASARKDGPFVVVDCGSIPRTLVEAELFGHERGAYTGASQSRPGAFVRANKGSIFLDEIGELDVELQPRLLGVLERREVKPIGGAEPVPVDVRIIAATHQDLRRRANEGAFREDLYYRLAVARVRLPALRERMTDIPLLIQQFLAQHAQKDGMDYRLDDDLSKRLVLRPWPGNIRELRNVVEQFIAFGMEEVSVSEPPRAIERVDAPFKVAKARIVARFEHEYLLSVLARHKGNITASASAAELDRVHFLRLLDRHGLRKSRVKNS